MISRRSIVPFAFLLVVPLCLLPACKPKQEIVDPVLVRIDNRSITLGEFQNEFNKSIPGGQTLTEEERSDLERSFLVQIVDRELALAEAARLDLSISPQELEEALAEHRRDYPDDTFEQILRDRGLTLDQWRLKLEQGLLMEKVARQEAYSALLVSDEEIETYYRERRNGFDRPSQVRARQIVVSSEEEGRVALARLKEGESFESVARAVSLSPDSEEGGDLGFFARGEMPAEFEEVVFVLPPGQISELIRSEYGFHIFLVEEHREAVHLTVEQARQEIRGEILAQKEEAAYQLWLQKLRARAFIEVNWVLL